jgi:hypothetical protein
MNLHTDKKLFVSAVSAAGNRFGVAEKYIEKDYWVTLALFEIFRSAVATDTVFKGGTALAKCHKLIERFSEDIDVVAMRKDGETDNQLKKKLKTISDTVCGFMPEIEVTGITHKRGQIRKTAHQFPKETFSGEYGQVREYIVIEASWFGSHEPFIIAEVSSYIGDMMKTVGQDELIAKYNLQPFQVKVLSKERTLCEKIMSLVRFSHTDNPYVDLSNKIRHVYDIHMMLKNNEVKSFLNSSDFDLMLNIVGKDDLLSFKNNNDWLSIHPKEAIMFSDIEATWNKINGAYNTTFKGMVLGDLPEEKELIKTLKLVSNRLNEVNWNVFN